jgi:phage shock protein A
MTAIEKYNELLKEVGQLLKEKNDRIAVLEWQIEGLERKVKELESGKVCKREIKPM